MSELEDWLRENEMTQQGLAADVGIAQASVGRALAGTAGKRVAGILSRRTGLDPAPMMGFRKATPSADHGSSPEDQAGDDEDDPEGSRGG